MPCRAISCCGVKLFLVVVSNYSLSFSNYHLSCKGLTYFVFSAILDDVVEVRLMQKSKPHTNPPLLTYYVHHNSWYCLFTQSSISFKACFDFILGSSLSMKIQIMGGKITKNLGFKFPLSGRSKNFCSFFFSFSNFSLKRGYLLF